MPNWDEKRTLREWMSWWYNLGEDKKQKYTREAWAERNEPFFREQERWNALFGVRPRKKEPEKPKPAPTWIADPYWYESARYSHPWAMGARRF